VVADEQERNSLALGTSDSRTERGGGGANTLVSAVVVVTAQQTSEQPRETGSNKRGRGQTRQALPLRWKKILRFQPISSNSLGRGCDEKNCCPVHLAQFQHRVPQILNLGSRADGSHIDTTQQQVIRLRLNDETTCRKWSGESIAGKYQTHTLNSCAVSGPALPVEKEGDKESLMGEVKIVPVG
jgi:hypothetical protein